MLHHVRAHAAAPPGMFSLTVPTGGGKTLQPYTVQIPPHVRARLLAAGAARTVAEARFEQQFVVLTNTDLYAPDVGLSWDDPTFRRAEGMIS